MMDIAIIATDLALYFKLVFLLILRIRIAIAMIITVRNIIAPSDSYVLCARHNPCAMDHYFSPQLRELDSIAPIVQTENRDPGKEIC